MAMDALKRNKIAATSVEITQLGFGAGSLGDPFEVTSDQQAHETISLAYQQGINYFDTAPWYGNTKSEHRVGQFLRNKPKDSYFINTKVGRIYHRPKDVADFHNSAWMKRWKGGLPFDLTFDFTYDGIMRSYEDSLQRLGINSVDSLTIHDLDFRHQQNEEGVLNRLDELDKGKGYQALAELKSRGEIKAIGVGINHVGMIPRFLERFEIDSFLVAMPYTLMDQEALKDEFPLCQQQGASVIIGAPFCSGILAGGVDKNPIYATKPAKDEVIQKVKKINDVCSQYEVPLGAAALQFTLGHAVVASVIPGPNSPEQVQSNKNWLEMDIPTSFWEALKSKGLIRQDAPIPT